MGRREGLTKAQMAESLRLDQGATEWRRLGSASTIGWLDFEGFLAFPRDGRRWHVRFAIVRNGTAGLYEALDVSVVSPERGEISSKRFLFSDYLDDVLVGVYQERQRPRIWNNNGWEWYGGEPKGLDRLREAVTRYLWHCEVLE